MLDLQPLWLLKLILKRQIKTANAFIFIKSNFPENFSQLEIVEAMIPGQHTVKMSII